MQIIIANNLHGPRVALGFTCSRLILREQGFREYWKHINGFRVHANRKVYFIELWNPSYPWKRFGVVNHYRRWPR